MDFYKLMSVASNEQKVKEKELGKTKKGIKTDFTTPKDTRKSKILNEKDEEKRKKLEQIRARVAAQEKKKIDKPRNAMDDWKKDEFINDFTETGLSENDIRRKKLSDAQTARKRREFLEKVKRLKERPIGSEEINDVPDIRVDKTKINGEHKSKEKEKEHRAKDRDHRHKDKHHKEKHREDRDKHREDRDKHRSYHHKNKSANLDTKSSVNHKNIDCTPSAKSDTDSVTLEKKNPPLVKKKRPPPGPPPMSFAELLSMAHKNRDDPNAILEAVKPKPKPKVQVKDKPKPENIPDRPMTQEEKDRIKRTQTAEYQRWIAQGGARPKSCPVSSSSRHRARARPISRERVSVSSDDDSSDTEIAPKSKPVPKLCSNKKPDQGEEVKPKRRRRKGIVMASTEEKEKALAKLGYRVTPQNNGKMLTGETTKNTIKNTPISEKPSKNEKPMQAETKVSAPSETDIMEKVRLYKEKLMAKYNNKDSSEKLNKNGHSTSSKKPQMTSKSDSSQKSKSKQSVTSGVPKGSAKSNAPMKSGSSSKSGQYNATHENLLVCGDDDDSYESEEEIKRPSKKKVAVGSKMKGRPAEPTNPWDRIYGEIQKNHPKHLEKKRKHVIESDDEFEDIDDFIDDDGDMDGFIDDSEAPDYSSYIQEIFGYDKRRFRDEEDDVSDMETGFSQQLMEENRSARIGLMEDLEDMKREEEELKREKMMKLKKKKMKMR